MHKLILAVLLTVATALSAYAGGMAVFDSQGALYDSKQLEQMLKDVELGENQLGVLEEQYDTLKEAYEKAHTNYGRAKGVYDEMMQVKQLYDETKATMMGRFEKLKGVYHSKDPQKSFEELSDLLDIAFDDPRNIDSLQLRQLMDQKFDVQQLALKELISSNEETMKGMANRVDKVQDLAKQVDETESEKDALDVNNRLLLEILMCLQEMLAMDAKYQQTMGTLNYAGVSEQSIQARQNKLKELEEHSEKYSFEREVIDTYGVDVKSDSIFDAMKKVINKGAI